VCSGLVAACGARWSDEERAAVHARGSAAAAAPAEAAPAQQDTTPTTTAVAGASDGAAVASGGGGTATTVAVAGGSLPCAAHSTEKGVADRVLTVGNLATVSGPVPGLGATAQAGARAYVAYLNSIGGVCGRQVRLLTADDGNEGTRARAVVTDLAPKVLGMIGWFAPSGGAAADVIHKERLPITGTLGDAAIRAEPTAFNLNPPPPKTPYKKFDYLKAEGVRTAAVITLSAAAAVDELNVQQAQMESAGIRIVSRQILPVTTLSFDSAARVVANSKADLMFFLGAEGMDASMAQSMRGTGYHLKFEEYVTGYGAKYPALAGSAAEGTSSWIRSVPIEDAGSVPEMAKLLQWMRRTVPGTDPDVFAVDAWASSKAFFDALQQLPGPISRDALVARLATYSTYEAGGLIGRIDLAHGVSNGCLIGMRYENGRWARMAPQSGFLC
jgi:ABC-type branched-subunit amino acid transport system substrate-binding protein